MKVIILLTTLCGFALAGIITHEDHKGHGKATSYQNIKLDHYHPVAVYIKKEDLKYLEHPVEIGKSSSSVKQEHGNKHEHGYAVQDIQHHINHHGHEEHGHAHQLQVHSGGYGHQGHHHVEVPVVHEEPVQHHKLTTHYQVQQEDEHDHQAVEEDDDESGHYQGYQGGLGNYQLADVDGYALQGHVAAAAAPHQNEGHSSGHSAGPLGHRYTTVDLSGHGKRES